jgi:PAS domain S-box-containing protein
MDDKMIKHLRILIIEDSDDDTELLLRNLKKGGYEPEWQRVETAQEMKTALQEKEWDIIIADYQLPEFTGLGALEIYNSTDLDIPFIIVSGTIGEEIAVETMRLGAHDYIMKDKLTRLVPAIERELREVTIRHEKQKAEAELKIAARQWQTTFDAMNDSICLLNTEGKILRSNQATADFFQIPIDQIVGRTCWNLVHGTSSPIDNCPFVKMKVTKQREILTLPVENNWLEVTVDPVFNDHGDIIGAVHVISDVTIRIRAEEKIKASLKEKEILLKEIHHRVKNNLQIICSLLSLQAQNIKDEHTLAMFEESRNRVRSMSLVHEELYHSDDFAHVDFSTYLENLISNLYRVYSTSSTKIKLEMKIEKITLGIDLAVPCGLIINELISNALKHAFPPSWQGRGKISVSFAEDDMGTVKLIVKDNGIGLSENIDIQKTESLGLHLIQILAEDQLGGKISLSRNRGTKFQIRFKRNFE